jgi:ADP-heptose:LPS heptosyltransferase
MSNILIIKHGSLGDLIQANGAMQDIKLFFKDSKVLLLTSKPYVNFMSGCPYLDGVLTDKRLPRWNLFYLSNLKKLLKRYEFSHVFDLQNTNRTNFYKKFIITKPIWSSTETILENGEKKKDFDQYPVLERMKKQLQRSNIKTKHINDINLTWAFSDISRLLKQYTNNDFILIFPFCSSKHERKRWPYYKELIVKIKEYYKNKYPILIAPGPDEINESKGLNAKVVLNNDKAINLNQLITLIHKSKYIISNDTGPAHICSHLKKDGLVLFGSHTSPDKVSIGNEKFKTIKVEDLSDLSLEKVFKEIKKNLH